MSHENTVAESEQDDAVELQDDAVIGKALRGSAFIGIGLMLIAAVVIYYMSGGEEQREIVKTELAPVDVRTASEVVLPSVPFEDVTSTAGIAFAHENGAYGEKLLPETMGGGCAFFDMDNDGDQDLLLVNSSHWPTDPKLAEHSPVTAGLYRNDGNGRFQDISAGSGLDVPLYGMGVATGDYDNDGRVDVFLSTVGSNRLFHNEGNGVFQDVTATAGVAGDELEWSTGCGWFDFDKDGDLDLFVCNYLKWSYESDISQDFQLTGGGRAYGRPQNFAGTFPCLYRNDGGGGFTEIGEQAGLHVRNAATGVPLAKSLGVTFSDFDGDGWLDIFVANDTVQNLLFRNTGGSSFEEIAVLSGVAFDMNGGARGAMGIDTARFRNNDSVGIAIGNFANEMSALYVSPGQQMQFVDEAVSTGLGPNSRLDLTFGVLYFDCDLDGRLDLFCANGHLEEDINRVQPSQHYEQPQKLFWNSGPAADTEFVPMGVESCGEALLKPMVGRGAACADIDNDGDLDLIVTSVGAKPRLLRNDQQTGHHWLRIRLEGTHSNRNAIGASVEVATADGVQIRDVMPTRSYLSQCESVVTFGLGRQTSVDSITITWPDGSRQEIGSLDADREHLIKEPRQVGPAGTAR